MRKLTFFTISSLSATPVFRLMLNDMDRSIFKNLELYEFFLPGLSSRFSFAHKYVELFRFDTVHDFNNQTPFQKIKKYVKSILYLSKLINNNTIFYACDLEVLALAVVIKSLKFSKCKIVYHQFEAVDRRNFNGIKKLSAGYLKKKGHLIDLAIFPEINRMNGFLDMVQHRSPKTFLFPNTCYPKKNIDNKADVVHSSKFVIGHIGNVSVDAFYLLNLLEAVKKFPVSDVDLIFVGVKSEQTKELILHHTPHAKIIGWVNHDELKGIYQKLDLGLILYKPLDFNTDCCAPNKMYEYWSYGIPVLAPQLKGLQGLFDITIRGRLTDFNSPEEVATSIAGEMRSRTPEKKENLVRHFDELLSVEIFIKNLEQEFKILSNG